MPAYASPTNKKITLSCNVSAGTDVITGTATVTLCDSAIPLCSGATVACAPVACDSSGANGVPISVTVPCDATTFRVGAFHEVAGASDFSVDPSTGVLTPIGTGGSDVTITLGGKGYSIPVITNPGSVNDTVVFTIK
jgi:hypothetical protein